MNIRECRKARRITQQELADKLNVSRSAVAMWETGECMPRTVILPKLARALGCGIAELYEDETKEGKDT